MLFRSIKLYSKESTMKVNAAGAEAIKDAISKLPAGKYDKFKLYGWVDSHVLWQEKILEKLKSSGNIQGFKQGIKNLFGLAGRPLKPTERLAGAWEASTSILKILADRGWWIISGLGKMLTKVPWVMAAIGIYAGVKYFSNRAESSDTEAADSAGQSDQQHHEESESSGSVPSRSGISDWDAPSHEAERQPSKPMSLEIGRAHV